jgi:hypothetical protein
LIRRIGRTSPETRAFISVATTGSSPGKPLTGDCDFIRNTSTGTSRETLKILHSIPWQMLRNGNQDVLAAVLLTVSLDLVFMERQRMMGRLRQVDSIVTIKCA